MTSGFSEVGGTSVSGSLLLHETNNRVEKRKHCQSESVLEYILNA